MSTGLSFNELAKVAKLESRSISAENIFGEKGKGGMTASPLGVGRKGSAWIWLKAGETKTLGEIQGPGCIRHMDHV